MFVLESINTSYQDLIMQNYLSQLMCYANCITNIRFFFGGGRYFEKMVFFKFVNTFLESKYKLNRFHFYVSYWFEDLKAGLSDWWQTTDDTDRQTDFCDHRPSPACDIYRHI